MKCCLKTRVPDGPPEQEVQLLQTGCAFGHFGKSLMVTQGHSKLHRWAWTCVLLIFHCNYVSILYRFWDVYRRLIALPEAVIARVIEGTENGTIRLPAGLSLQLWLRLVPFSSYLMLIISWPWNLGQGHSRSFETVPFFKRSHPVDVPP